MTSCLSYWLANSTNFSTRYLGLNYLHDFEELATDLQLTCTAKIIFQANLVQFPGSFLFLHRGSPISRMWATVHSHTNPNISLTDSLKHFDTRTDSPKLTISYRKSIPDTSLSLRLLPNLMWICLRLSSPKLPGETKLPLSSYSDINRPLQSEMRDATRGETGTSGGARKKRQSLFRRRIPHT